MINHADLLISGAGNLGLRVARRLLQAGLWRGLEAGKIVCETLTDEKHSALSDLGLRPKLASEPPVLSAALLMAFPPGPDYPQQVVRALAQWDRKRPALLVSSTSVYDENDGGLIDESARLRAPTAQRLGEEAAHEAGAHILRLGGLYSKSDGPHIHWQKIRQIQASPSVFINLIHRHDAADAVARLLVSSLPAQIWNLSDGHPLRRFDVDQLWSKHLKVTPAQFLDLEDPSLGKKISSEKIRRALNWQPRFESFQTFVASLEKPRNVLGSELKMCCSQPMTGFQRDGFCRNHGQDPGAHLVCSEVTDAFLKFSKERGNDLSTPQAEHHFVGLRPGDRWCLSAARWLEALQAGVAPRIYLESTDETMIEWVEPEVLRRFALDLA